MPVKRPVRPESVADKEWVYKGKFSFMDHLADAAKPFGGLKALAETGLLNEVIAAHTKSLEQGNLGIHTAIPIVIRSAIRKLPEELKDGGSFTPLKMIANIAAHPAAKEEFIRALSVFKSRHYTMTNRFIKIDVWLKKSGNKIDSYLDVGCGMMRGAPTTVKTKEIFGKDVRVVGTDIYPALAGFTRRTGVEFKQHDMTQTALQEGEFDVVRIGNVVGYLTKEKNRKLIENCIGNLANNGLLIICTGKKVAGFYRKIDGELFDSFHEVPEKLRQI